MRLSSTVDYKPPSPDQVVARVRTKKAHAAPRLPGAPPRIFVLGPDLAPPGPPHRLLLEAVNLVRKCYGRPPLVTSAEADAVAGGWARRLADHDRFEHNDLAAVLRAVPGATAAAECIAIDFGGTPTPLSAVARWVGDPAHRRLLLGPYTDAGGGYDPRGYWVLDLVTIPPPRADGGDE